MEDCSNTKRSRRPTIPLHILHFCFSFGLIVAVVHNQLVNNARFEKLESKCVCEETPFKAEKAKTNMTSSKSDLEFVATKSKPITKRDLEKELLDNHTRNDNYQSVNISKVGLDENQNSWKIKETANKTLEEKEQTLITKLLHADLVSCADKLKVIIDDYLSSNKKAARWKCKILKGQKGDKGSVGQQGERCCAGTSFAPPLIQPRSTKVVTNEGVTTVLHCNATANPAAKITWYRDEKLIKAKRDIESYRYSVTHRDMTPEGSSRARSFCPSEMPQPLIQSSLMIRNTSGLDTGIFACKATNFMGTSSLDVHMIVQEYVSSFIIPSNIAVVQGEDVLLSCRASGVPRPTITWYRKDDGPMPVQHRVAMGDLRIKNISKEEEGTFVCLAENVLGSKTTEATVTVNVFPKFQFFQEGALLFNKGENLILPCNATGYPIPEIKWQKINGTLPTGRYFYDSQFLRISNVQYEDKGEYECTANNSVGIITNQVSLTVQVPPVISKRPNSTEYGFKGKTKILEFGVFSLPEAEVTWVLPSHGQEIERFRQENGSLVIDNVQYKDSGLYQAVARNLLGEVRARIFLIVRDAVPAVVRSLQMKPDVSIFEGENVSQTCFAIGVPRPHMTWKGVNETLVSARNFHLTLTIKNVTTYDTGQYSCIASNQFGSDQRHFELKVIKRWVNVNINNDYNYNHWGQRGQYRYKSFSRSTGQVTSYNYPNVYPSSRRDTWQLTSNTRIKLEFLKFETERCCDKVKVYDGGSTSSRSLGEFSGEDLPPTIISSSTKLYITFNSDGSKGRSGFLAIYSSII